MSEAWSIAKALEVQRAGDFRKAELIYRQVLAREPKHARALNLLGLLCQKTGRSTEAIFLIRQAIAADPEVAEFHCDLAAVLGTVGQLEESAKLLRQAIQLRPNHVPAHHNLGVTLREMGSFDDAAMAFERVVALDPQNPVPQVQLASIRQKQGRFADAENGYRQAIAMHLNHSTAYAELAMLAQSRGNVRLASDCLARIVELEPDNALIHSSLISMLHYDPALSPEQLFQEHLVWAKQHERFDQSKILPHENDSSPYRRLRVGYLSADFREHTRARFLEPVLAHHDHAVVEVFCYSDVAMRDAITARFQNYADQWRETRGMKDLEVSQLIRSDRIDLLIEPTGHMAGNRLGVFALKPAPVQVTYPGYPNTTGLSSIDYCLTDDARDPESTDKFYTEALYRLPVSSQAFLPGEGMPEVGPLPALTAGFITFGSLNRPIKHNSQVLKIWSTLLHCLPQSRLLLLCPLEARDVFLRRFVECGISEERLELVLPRLRQRYVHLFNQIDILLDPWPYNGHTTTLDGLYMGVPSVCLEGKTHVSREGSAICRLLGLDNLIAADPAQYIQIAVALASDTARLNELRNTLRCRMLTSPLLDGIGLTRRLEKAYRQMWQNWCSALRPSAAI